MALPQAASPRTMIKANLNDPMANAPKGLLSRLFSRPPQVSTKTVAPQPSASEGLFYTREPPRRSKSRRHPTPQILTPDPPQSEACEIVDVPRCKSIKDNLQELGLTIPVVLTHPQVAGSETVLPRIDKAVSPQDMLLGSMRSASSKASCTSSPQSRPGSSRGNIHMTSYYAVNNDQPVLDITSSDGWFTPLSTPPSSRPGSSRGHASRVAVVEEFEDVPLPDAYNTVASSVQNDFSRVPPVQSCPTTPSGPSTSHSIHDHASSSNCPTRRQKSLSAHNRRISIASRDSQRYIAVEPASLFPVDEGLFGRPKPPPPLKIIPKKTKKHQRKATVATITSHERPLTRTAHNRSQTIHSVQQVPLSQPMGYFHVSDLIPSDSSTATSPSGSMPELPVPVHIHVRAPNKRTLSRTSTHTTVASDQTGESATSAPELPHNTRMMWTPPESWSGPSFATSTESGDSAPSTKKPVFSTITHLRRAKSSSRSVSSAAKPLYSHPDSSSATPAHSKKLSDEGLVPPTQEKRGSHGVVIKMQGFGGDDLKEAPLHDVIPRLREMKSSAL